MLNPLLCPRVADVVRATASFKTGLVTAQTDRTIIERAALEAALKQCGVTLHPEC